MPQREQKSVTLEWLGWVCAKQKKSKTRPCRQFKNILWTLCLFLSTSVLPGFANGVWYRDVPMSHNYPNSRTGSSTAPTAQSSAWTSAAVFSGKGPWLHTVPQLHCRVVQTSWSQLQGPLCWHPLCGTHIPWATHCRPQRKPVPALEIQLPAPKHQMNALESRSSFLLRFCAFFQTELGDVSEYSPTSRIHCPNVHI